MSEQAPKKKIAIMKSPEKNTNKAEKKLDNQLTKRDASENYKSKYQFLKVKFKENDGEYNWYHGKITRNNYKTGIGTTFSDGFYEKFTWNQLEELEKEQRITSSDEDKLDMAIKQYLSQHPNLKLTDAANIIYAEKQSEEKTTNKKKDAQLCKSEVPLQENMEAESLKATNHTLWKMVYLESYWDLGPSTS